MFATAGDHGPDRHGSKNIEDAAKAIARAKLSDIATVDGVSQALAERIYNYFHGS